MTKGLLTLIVCIISLIISIVSTYIMKKRIIQIEELPETIIEKKEKDNYLTELNTKTYVTFISIILNAVNLVLPDSTLKFLVPALGIIICCFLLIGVMDEIDIFNVKKDDADVFQERIKEKQEELKLQKEILENARKKNKK